MSEQKPSTPKKGRCLECGSERSIRDYETAEVVCIECGFVIDEKIADSGPEWRAFDMEQRAKRTRVGAPITQTIHDKGLSTMIGWSNRDFYNKKLSSEKRAQLYRMRKWQRRIRVSDSTERNLASALSAMSRMCSSMGLPKNVLETASVIYRRNLKKNMRGRLIKGIVAASIYMACRKCGVARTLDDVATSSDMNKKEVGKYYRYLIKELREFVPPLPPSCYISRFVNNLELVGGVETIALQILTVAKKARLTSGRGPQGMAAAATYIASNIVNDRRTQREVAEVANVTEVTIRNRYKELVESFQYTINL
jgi:transcription initiation factor TFIIB